MCAGAIFHRRRTRDSEHPVVDRATLKRQLIVDEGLRLRPYRCTAGKLTIGIGRNLDDLGITREEALMLAENDIIRVEQELDATLPWWREMSERRQQALANMCFNLGIQRLLKFTNTLAAMEQGDYEAAAAGMKASAWFRQVGERAVRLVDAMRRG